MSHVHQRNDVEFAELPYTFNGHLFSIPVMTNARVIDKYIDVADLGGYTRPLFIGRHVTHDCGDVRPALRESGETFLVTGDGKYTRPSVRKKLGDGSAYSGGGSRYDNDTILEAHDTTTLQQAGQGKQRSRNQGGAMAESVTVVEATEFSDELEKAFSRLLPQLSNSHPVISRAELEELVGNPSTRVLTAVADGEIVGTLTLVIFPIPTGRRAWIEDVVVDAAARGRGIGEALCRAAIDRARSEGVRSVDLTSRPSREAANRLYARMGFTLRDTNVYRFTEEEQGG